MEKMPYAQIQRGTFLIATPDIESGIFFRSVVLLCDHTPNGSFGILLNKNLPFDLPEELAQGANLVNPRIGVRAGGPVQTNQMMLLHDSSRLAGEALKICDEVYLGGGLPFLQETLHDENGPNTLLCFGYAGWAPGQLEREFLDGHWLLYPATSRHVFYTKPEKIWQILLRDMGGKYAHMAMIPEDLTVN